MRCPKCRQHVTSFWSWRSRQVESMPDMPGPCPHCRVRLEPKGRNRLYPFFAGTVAVAVIVAAFELLLWCIPDEIVPRRDRGWGLALVLFPALLLGCVVFYGLLYLRWLTGWYQVDRPRTQAAEKVRVASVSTPPRCLRRLQAESAPVPAEWPGDLPAAWSLACPCGSREGAVVVEAGAASDWREVRRLAFRCVRCATATEFLDTWADGSTAETEGPTGAGPDADASAEATRPFACPRCGASRGTVVVVLYYQEASASLADKDGGAVPLENLFDYVRVCIECSQCGERSLAAETET